MSRQLEHSASLGGSEAHFCLGDMIFNGTDGYSVNYPKALRHFAAAARNRHAGALTSVGAMLYNGLGTKRDLGLAFRAYQLAAEAGSIAAMRNLASMHMLGEGCEKDMAKAKVLTKVADEAEAELERGGGLPTMQ
jgi:TPR repeat protein